MVRSLEPVSNRRTKRLAFALSSLAHAIPLTVGLFAWSPDLDLGEVEFEFADVEMVDPNTLLGDEPEPEPEPEATYPPPAAELPPEGDEGGDPPEPEPEPEPEKKFGDDKSKVDGLGPTTSTLTAFMVTKRVRKLPYAEQGMELIAPLPDFRYLIQGGGFNTLQDFEYLVIATPNPRDITQTFLAVEHNMTAAEIRAGVERAVSNANETIEWEERNGLVMGNPKSRDPDAFEDPRWFVFLDSKRVVYVREEFLPSITGDAAAAATEDRKTTGSFVANLTQMRRFAAREPNAGLQLIFKDLHAQLRSAKFPCAVPDAGELMAEAARDPELMVRLTFLSPADAKSCETFWNDKLKQLIDSSLAIKLAAGWIYDSFELNVDGNDLTLRAQFEGEQATAILDLLAGQARKMFRLSKEEMEAARKEREEQWARREGGKLPPSAAFAPAPQQHNRGDAADDGGNSPSGPDAGTGPMPPGPVIQPTPDDGDDAAVAPVTPTKSDETSESAAVETPN